ncbi:L,D-transpeptidase family protein [Clostridium estertheticum]|uniref:L,D-transpeptidase family protein n=1 Tax=Clostridium estertheticum TaxID=238834 RepID=UPI0013EE43C6|nr:L,D-transpeptidase family protein [Clostridium estertheticum]MBZ9608825.1 L,D-transpeptidase family protein [Clostridium estertheticum]
MNKRYLSGIVFIVVVMISGCTLANKSEAAVKLPPSDAKIYQTNVRMSQNSIQKENVQNNSIKLLAQKKQQPIAQIILKQGNKGSKVKEIQQKLNKFGYKLYADGDFGRLTYYAVIDFQMRNKLIKDGIVGNLTLKKLNMKPTSQSMYKPPVIQKYTPKVSVSNNSLEKTINSKNIYSSTAYFIWIDLSHQRVNIFKGSNRKWNLVRSMVCSSGKSRTPTVKGNFTVGIKGSYFISDGGARCKYYTQIRGNYLFHSVLYDRKGNYVIDNTLGVPVSHGCVRLALKDAKFIYDNIPARTAIWSK